MSLKIRQASKLNDYRVCVNVYPNRAGCPKMFTLIVQCVHKYALRFLSLRRYVTDIVWKTAVPDIVTLQQYMRDAIRLKPYMKCIHSLEAIVVELVVAGQCDETSPAGRK